MSGSPAFALWPQVEKIIPWNNATTDGWIVSSNLTANNTFFRSQWVQCQYPISGGYGLTSRIVFYLLAAISIFGRGHEWTVGAALGAVMIYSSTAAVHALILVGIRQLLAPSWLFPEYQVVLAEGEAPDGLYGDMSMTQPNAPLWLPIIPMAWDNDCDPTLLITGVAFLLLLPMYNFSKTLKKVSPEKRAIIALWALLLFAGLIAALVNYAYVFYWSFPQLRFCPVDQADDLPLQNNGAPSVTRPWDHQDWYLWNRTVQDYFVFKNTSFRATTTCLYTCFDTSWPLRDPTDIQVVSSNVGGQFNSTSMLDFQFAVYVMVGYAAAGCMTLALMEKLSCIPARWRIFNLAKAWRALLSVADELRFATHTKFNCKRAFSKLGEMILLSWIVTVIIYSSVLSFLALIAFVVYYEWEIADSDPGGESFRHIGQWSVLVGAGLALAAVTFSKVISQKSDNSKDANASPQGSSLHNQSTQTTK